MNNSFRSSDLIKLHSITLTNTYINFGGGDGLIKARELCMFIRTHVVERLSPLTNREEFWGLL